MRYAFLVLIWIYQHTLSIVFGNQCRFYPTCSEYGMDALIEKPSWRGLPLIAWRIVRCQPLCTGGVDKVNVLPSDRDYQIPWKWRRPSKSCVLHADEK